MSKIEAPEIIIVDYNGIKIDAYNRPDADRYIDTLTSELAEVKGVAKQAVELLDCANESLLEEGVTFPDIDNFLNSNSVKKLEE